MTATARILAPDVLALPDGSELVSTLRACEVSLGEALRLLAAMPRVSWIEDERGLRFINPELPPESMVMATRWPEQAAAQYLDEELARFASAGVRVDWYIFGPPSPPDLADRLVARGLVRETVRWQFADLGALPPAPASPPELRIVEATTAHTMADWRRAFATGFGTEIGARKYHDAYVSQPRESPGVQVRLHHVAYSGDMPVACSTLLVVCGLATLWDIATDPAYRRRGYAAALVRRQLEAAIGRGCRRAALNSSALGYSMYVKAGFDTMVLVPELQWAPPS